MMLGRRIRAFVFLAAATLVVISPRPTLAYIINGFAASVFNTDTAAMNVALGISGYVIEGFELGGSSSITVVDGLALEYSFAPNTAALETTFIEERSRIRDIPTHAWDGRFINTNESIQPGQAVTYHLLNGAVSFGIGLGDYDNGVDK